MNITYCYASEIVEINKCWVEDSNGYWRERSNSLSMNDLFGDDNNWSWCLQNLDDVIKTHGAPCRAWVTLLNVDDAINTHGAPCRAWVNLTWYARRHSQWQHLCETAALYVSGNLHQWSRGGRLKLVVWFRGHCQSVWIETRSASLW